MPRLAIDWDGTCVTNAYPDMGIWLPGAVETLTRLKRKYELVIHSCRVADFETDERTPIDGGIEARKIEAMLTDAGLKNIEVWRRPYKPPAAFYVDDKAIRFTTWRESEALIRMLGD